METNAEANPSVASGATMAEALASLLAEQKRLRSEQKTMQAAAQAEHTALQAAAQAKHSAREEENSARQDAVDVLLADVTTMGTKSPEEQEALVARIAASMTSSAGVEVEDEQAEEEEEGGREAKLSTKEQEVKETLLVGTRFEVQGSIATVDAIAADGTYFLDIGKDKVHPISLLQLSNMQFVILSPLTEEERVEKEETKRRNNARSVFHLTAL